jgi:phage anti-repressor protein
MEITKLASITIKTDYSTAIAQYLKGKDFEIVLAAGRSPAMTFRMEKGNYFRECFPSIRCLSPSLLTYTETDEVAVASATPLLAW